MCIHVVGHVVSDSLKRKYRHFYFFYFELQENDNFGNNQFWKFRQIDDISVQKIYIVILTVFHASELKLTTFPFQKY